MNENKQHKTHARIRMANIRNYLGILQHRFVLQYPQPLFVPSWFYMYIILSLSSSLFTFASVFLSRAILLTLHNSICRCTYIFCHVLHHMIEFSLNLCALRNTSFTQSNIHETFVFLFCSNLLLVITVYRDNSVLHASKCLDDCMKNNSTGKPINQILIYVYKANIT